MELLPCEFAEAKAFIIANHRHHRPPLSHRFSLKAVKDDQVVGVVVVGRPVSRHQQDGYTVEVTRLCTDGTRNACSFLIGAAKRAARALGYRRMISYTLEEEPGSSWVAAGMRQVGTTKPEPWHSKISQRGRTLRLPEFTERQNRHPTGKKRVWEVTLS